MKGVSGFGSALVAMPVLLLFFEPRVGILMLSLVELVTGAWLLKDVWGALQTRLVWVRVLGMGFGQLLGTRWVSAVEPGQLRFLLGLLVGGMGLRALFRPVQPGRGERTRADGPLLLQGGVAATGGGVLAGLVGAGGPPLVIWVRHHFEDGVGRAHLVATFYAGSISLTGLLLVQGTSTEPVTSLPVLLVPALLGSRLGAWLAPRLDRVRFARFVGLLLLGTGLVLMAR